MDTEKIKFLINEYFDNELDKEREIFLFSTLAYDDEAREYFKMMNKIRISIEDEKETLSNSIDEKILRHVSNLHTKVPTVQKLKQNIVVVILSVLMIFVSIGFYFQNKMYREEIKSVVNVVKEQKQTIDLLIYSTFNPAVIEKKVFKKTKLKTNS